MSRFHATLAAAALCGLCLAPAARADDCAPLVAAMVKQAHMPSRSTAIVRRPGRPQETQISVYLPGKMYVSEAGGGWIAFALSADKLIATFQEGIGGANAVCRRAADETVAGQAASVWRIHVAQRGGGTADTRSWLSKASGLAIKMENHIVGPEGVTDISATYDYRDVRAPAGVP